MKSYKEIIESLGFDADNLSLDNILSQDQSLDLGDARIKIREIQQEIEKQIRLEEKKVQKLQSEIPKHNRRATDLVKKNKFEEARSELESKKRKLNTVQRKEEQIGRMREALERLEDTSRRIADKLDSLRNP